MNYCKVFLLLLIPIQGIGQEQFIHFLPKESGWHEDNCLLLSFEIEEGYYIQANRVLNENFIPTVLEVSNSSSSAIRRIHYPASELLLLGGAEEVVVFRGKVQIWIETDGFDFKAANQLSGNLFYQACNKQKCFFPRRLSFELDDGMLSTGI